MNISIPYRNVALAASLVHIILFCWIVIGNINHFNGNLTLQDALSIISTGAFIIVLFYLLAIVKFAGESQALVMALYIFIGASLLSVVPNLFNLHLANQLVINSITGGLTTISAIYLLIVAFMVKNPIISPGFKIYAVAEILKIIYVFGISIFMFYLTYIHAYWGFLKYTSLFAIIPDLALTYIIIVSANLLKPQETAPTRPYTDR